MERLLPINHEGSTRHDGAFFGSARAGIVLTLHLGAVTNYINRICLSVAIDGDGGIAAHEGWSDTQKGLVLSSFFYGYVIAQTPAGWLAIRHGPRRDEPDAARRVVELAELRVVLRVVVVREI